MSNTAGNWTDRRALGVAALSYPTRVAGELLWVFLGIILILVTYKFPYEKLQKKTCFLILINLILLMYLDLKKGGRWIPLGFLNIQVSDIARLSLIIFLADSLSRKEQFLESFKEGLISHLFYILLFSFLIVI